MTVDYRESHKKPGKGREYHAKFSASVHRATIWEIEQTALRRMIRERFSGKKVRHLDFACGTGRVLQCLREFASISVGVDISDSMMEVARSAAPNSTLIKADLTRETPLLEQTFDVITAFRFFPNAQAELRYSAMRALAHQLAPGGVIVFNNHLNTASSRYRLARIVRRRLPAGMSHEDAAALAESCGLQIFQVAHAGVLPSDERFLFMPSFLFRSAELLGARVRALRPLAQDIIYGCTHSSAPASARLLD